LKNLRHPIENNLSLKGKIKLIGIGVGNFLCKVQQLENATDVPIPIFPNKDIAIYKTFGSEKGGFNEVQTLYRS